MEKIEPQRSGLQSCRDGSFAGPGVPPPPSLPFRSPCLRRELAKEPSVARGETAELPLAVLKEHIGDGDFFGTTSRPGWKTFVGCTAGYSERADANQGLKAPHK